ncbi:MAG: hypothetical protein JF570_08840 [Caulobacter sp.]|nr:hypothetical protein [Caulobacter sp.]
MKTIARKIGWKSLSNGQFMKTDRAAGNLTLGRGVTRRIVHCPEPFPDDLGDRGPFSDHGLDRDPPIDDSAILPADVSLRRAGGRCLARSRHGRNYGMKQRVNK